MPFGLFPMSSVPEWWLLSKSVWLRERCLLCDDRRDWYGLWVKRILFLRLG